MAELEIDRTNLPPIQDVAQYFSVLEDGALAHNLQEQEIEQHYSSNIQRNQLIQRDIRVAKRLQHEEHQQAHVLHYQDTRQLEEQDSEYARRVQEEIWQADKDAQRREEEDEEIAKRVQEKEDLLAIQSNSYKRAETRVPGRTCLDLSDLQQVLKDEELAHRLQEEEETLHRRASTFRCPSLGLYPEGDFRVAQVAQDEEIAHFMQEQEIKSQVSLQGLEDSGSEQECAGVSRLHDVGHTQMHSGAVDSEDPVSPDNEYSHQHQPPSPAAPAVNIAEQLDPTFQREEQILAEQNLTEPCHTPGTPEVWSNGEPTFVMPTKRHNVKSGHEKSKQKKDNLKQKETCKQQ